VRPRDRFFLYILENWKSGEDIRLKLSRAFRVWIIEILTTRYYYYSSNATKQGNLLHELYSERALLSLHIRDRRRAQPAQESFTVHWERDEAHRERRRGVLFAVGVSAIETSSSFG
jgi:hypothetical protein